MNSSIKLFKHIYLLVNVLILHTSDKTVLEKESPPVMKIFFNDGTNTEAWFSRAGKKAVFTCDNVEIDIGELVAKVGDDEGATGDEAGAKVEEVGVKVQTSLKTPEFPYPPVK